MSFMSRLLSKKPKTGASNKSDSSMEPAQFRGVAWSPELIPLNQQAVALQNQSNEIAIKEREVQALETLASSISRISQFINGPGLGSALSLYARTNSISGILSGLAAHDGRNALDARVLGQNSIEIVEQISLAFDKLQEKLEAKMKGEIRDPDIHDPEVDYKKWKEQQ